MGGSPSSNTPQDDDMVSWLHLDDSSCSQLFGEVDRASSSIQQSIPSSGGPTNMQKKRANADAELALAAGRAAGLSPQIGVETFDKARTVCQTSMRKWPYEVYTPVKQLTSTMVHPRSQSADTVNFPQFSVTVARARARMHSDAVAADCTNKNYLKNEEATSMESNRSTMDCKSCTSMQQWNDQSLQADTDVSITDPERNCSYDTKYSELDSATARKVHNKQATEMDTFTSSSDGSGNAGGDNSEKYVPSSLKRKEREVEDTAGCQGKTTGIGYADTKKPSSGRETTSKRRRAAEVHNLSERRRRDRINERMKALQELIPNSSKTDKASMLDEAIEYLKMLQLQLQVMSMRSGMNMAPIIVPTAMPHLQIPHITTYGGMGLRLMEVSGHSPHTTLPLNLAATSSSMAATTRVLNGLPSAQLLQGMNMEMYHAYVLGQHQQQQVQEHYQDQQQQLGKDHQS